MVLFLTLYLVFLKQHKSPMIALSHFLIVEDELLIAETISDYLKNEGCQNITIVESVDEAIFELENNKIDFVLTDIALGQEKSGIELGQIIQTIYKIPFIYITSHTDKVMIERAKHTMPDAYIIKPFKKDDLIIAIDFALYNASNNALRSNEKNELIIKEGRALVRLFHENILWLESEGNYTSINLKNDKRRVVRTSLSAFEEQLTSADFVRIHKSFLVNKIHVTEVRANSVIIDNQELSVGRTYQQNLVDMFN
jgi:two-component system response regulator LytT